ncbi:MAG: hypothetical protein L0J13_16010 [Brevibacterium sp.]|nr:hypothetical protein [Brevibacterium sp.]
MIDWIPAAVLVAIIGAVGTIYGVRSNRKSAKEEIQIRDSENLAKRVNSLWQRVDDQDEKIKTLNSRIQTMAQNETKLKALLAKSDHYIRVLVDFISRKGFDPPDPPAEPDYTL